MYRKKAVVFFQFLFYLQSHRLPVTVLLSVRKLDHNTGQIDLYTPMIDLTSVFCCCKLGNRGVGAQPLSREGGT